MAHGQPDYGMYAAKSTVGSMADNAELAARLGSIVTYDRKGDVVWLDDFESGINKWQAVVAGVGAGVIASNAAARNGGFSALLTTGNAIGNSAEIRRYLPRPVLSKVGLEVSFTTIGNINYIYIWINTEIAGTLYSSYIRYSRPLLTLECWDRTAGLVVIAAGVGLLASIYMFHTMKLVVDLVGVPHKPYVKLLLNEQVIDLSAYELREVAGVGQDSLEIACGVTTSVAANRSIHVDDVIVTQNEP